MEDDLLANIQTKRASMRQKAKKEQTQKSVLALPAEQQNECKRRKSAKELHIGFLQGVPDTAAKRSQSSLDFESATILPLAPGTPAVLPAPLPPPLEQSAPSTTRGSSRDMSSVNVSPVAGPSRGFSPSTSPAEDENIAGPSGVNLSPEAGLSTDIDSDDDDDSIDSDETAEDRQADKIYVEWLVLTRPSILVTDSPAVLEDSDPTIMNDIAQMDRQNDTAMHATLPTDRISFNWRTDMDDFTGVREEFTGTPGPTFPMLDIQSPVDVFLKIWDQSIMSLIERETNQYAAQCLDSPGISAQSRLLQWQPTSVHELYVFFAVLIHQSLTPLTDESEYFNPSSRITAMPYFQEFITYNRLILLKHFLHFSNNGNIPQSLSSEEQSLHKIQPICNHLNRKFQDLYLPGQNIAIAESLLKWHGRLTFIQKIAMKAAKQGIKSYELCESDTGYLWKFFIYAGKAATTDSENREDLTDRPDETGPDRTDYQTAGATAKIVYDLASPLFGKGYTIIMDNFYNSPLLARSLKLRGTDCYGTLRLGREHVPDSMKSLTQPQMKKGEVVSSTSGDLNVIVWKDTGLVSMLSTYHKVQIGATEKYGHGKFKPRVVLDYNLAMGGVNKMEKMLANFPLEQLGNCIWYKKLFRRLLNISVQNAYIIYRCKDKTITHRDFRLQVAEGLFKSFLQQSVPPEIPIRVRAVRQVPSSIRGGKPRTILANNHFITKITEPPVRRKCACCADLKIQRRTTWMCDACEVALCIECMKPYHTQPRV